MARHILDRNDRSRGLSTAAIADRYARAALQQDEGGPLRDRKLYTLLRRARGPHDPSARLKAYLRIARGRQA